ncbi:hypothetical protein VTK56DRAFT_9478 [Thermocarpiscus australiensis]
MTDQARPPRRPATRRDFEVAVICALPLEADAVDALFDHYWDDDVDGGGGGNPPPYGKAAGDPNAYSTGVIGRHNVVLAHMPGMGKVSAATVAAHCRASFPNVKLALVVGVCGGVPFGPDGAEIVLGDVIVSEGVVQYDFGRRLPDGFVVKDKVQDALGPPNAEIRRLLAKLKGPWGRRVLRDAMVGYMDVLQAEPDLAAGYPGAAQDQLYEATYRHVGGGRSCGECGCDEGRLVPRSRLGQDANPRPEVHFGLMASGDTVMRSGEDRDAIARQFGVIGFEMESAGVWDSFPCVVIKGVCDYADSHKSKVWQRYAAATAAAYLKAFLSQRVPSLPEPLSVLAQPARSWFLVPYAENKGFIGRKSILEKLRQQLWEHRSRSRLALFGLGGVGKTQIALAYAYWLRETSPDVSVFWVHASNAERFQQSFASIARECRVPGYDDPKADIMSLLKMWLEKHDRGRWLMVIDNADDMQLFVGGTADPSKNLGRYVPESAHGSVLITTRNKQAGLNLAQGNTPIEVGKMDDAESDELLRTKLNVSHAASDELSMLSARMEYLPLALVHAAAFIEANTITVGHCLQLLDESDQNVVDLLSWEFETVGRGWETPRAVTESWILSFEQMRLQNPFAGELLSLMSLFGQQSIPLEFLNRYSEWPQDGKPKGTIEITEALGTLKAFCFVVEDEGHRFKMHRLVQLVARKWLVENGTLARFVERHTLGDVRGLPGRQV